MGKSVVVLGSQWGDEGKGKLADVLAAEYDARLGADGVPF